MKTKLLIITLLVLAIAGASTAAFADRNTCTGGNDAAQWSANTDSLASVDVGGSVTLGVNMTSPTCLNGFPTFPGLLPVYADVTSGSATCLDGSSGSNATCTLTAPVPTITNNPLSYTDFGQTQTYQVQFDAKNATPGTYTFHVHANAADPNEQHWNGTNLGGYGWGYGSGLDLTIVVRTPSTDCSGDLVNVNLANPGNVQFCTAGTSVPISFTATSTKSVITGVSADVNGSYAISLTTSPLNQATVTATGSFAAPGVGGYTANAYGIDACGVTGSATQNFGVIYVISGLQPPLAGGSKSKGGSDAPIKFIPTDCTGALIPFDNTVEVKVWLGSPGIGTLEQDSTMTTCSALQCGSGANTLVRYDATTGQYITNFTTLAGAKTYTVQLIFNGYVNATFNFSTSK
jgi:hypothetical protein